MYIPRVAPLFLPRIYALHLSKWNFRSCPIKWTTDWIHLSKYEFSLHERYIRSDFYHERALIELCERCLSTDGFKQIFCPSNIWKYQSRKEARPERKKKNVCLTLSLRSSPLHIPKCTHFDWIIFWVLRSFEIESFSEFSHFDKGLERSFFSLNKL